MSTDNRTVFTRVLDASNSHDDELVAKTVDEVFLPDARMATPLPIRTTGPEAVKQLLAMLHGAFPDLHIAVEDLIAEGDKVVVRNTVTGTHTGGEYLGLPATGKSVSYNEIFVLRFEHGRIAETWGVVDVLAQMKQLGVVQA